MRDGNPDSKPVTGEVKALRQKLEGAERKIVVLEREVRVLRIISRRKAKEDRINLEKEDRQVAVFLEASKAWGKELDAVSVATSKFSPEARRFTIRKLSKLVNAETLLAQALGGNIQDALH